MLRVVKFLAILLIIGIVGLTGYAYLGDLDPQRSERAVPVTLDAR